MDRGWKYPRKGVSFENSTSKGTHRRTLAEDIRSLPRLSLSGDSTRVPLETLTLPRSLYRVWLRSPSRKHGGEVEQWPHSVEGNRILLKSFPDTILANRPLPGPVTPLFTESGLLVSTFRVHRRWHIGSIKWCVRIRRFTWIIIITLWSFILTQRLLWISGSAVLLLSPVTLSAHSFRIFGVFGF